MSSFASSTPGDHRRVSAAWLLAVLLIAAMLGAPASARAEPGDEDAAVDVPAEPPADVELALPWTALGQPNAITLIGPNNSSIVPVPVPSGMTPRRLRGLMDAPLNFGAGFLEIKDGGGTLLGAVDLPPVSAEQAVVPFDVDISAAQVVASTVSLSFTVRQADGTTQTCGADQRLFVRDLAMVFGGTEPAPTTIADYFPSVLQSVAIYAPADADKPEQESVLTLASALTRLYQPQPIAVTVINQPRGAAPPPSAPLNRAIVVERGDAGLDVINGGTPDAYLRVSGSGDQLLNQTSLLVNQLQSLVQVPTARITQAGSQSGLNSETMSFAQLNMSGKTEFLRASTFTTGVDQAALGGGRVDNIQVRLLGTYTPVASQDSAALVVSVNGQALYTSPLDSTGRLDATFDVPRFLISQRINFDFNLTYTPFLQCSPLVAPLTFQLDPRSTLTVRHGGDPGAQFNSMPSEFTPEFVVGFDGTSPDQLRYASRLLVDMARLTTTALKPHVVDFKAATDAKQGALIVANAKSVEGTSLHPPIGGDGSSIQVDLPDTVRADIDHGLGSIQVIADQPRQRTVVLVTTSGDWPLVEPVLDYIERQQDGWSSLTGNVLAAGTQGFVANLSIGLKDNAIGPVNTPVESPKAESWITWLGVGVGVACIILAGAAAAIWWSRRRRTRTGDGW